jgi:hypothetical protein
VYSIINTSPKIPSLKRKLKYNEWTSQKLYFKGVDKVRKQIIFFSSLVTILLIMGICKTASAYPNIPKDGFVPDKMTAVKIAEAILIPIYGEEDVINHRPFTAELEKNIWIINGSLKENVVGGTPHVELQKSDGKILMVFHTK